MDAGAVCFEGHGCGRLRTDFHRDAIAFQGEAVGEVFDKLFVGDVNGNFVAFVDFKFGKTVGRCGRGHIDTNFIAITDDGVGGVEIDAVFFRLFARFFPVVVITVPDTERVHLVAGDNDHVVRFGEARAVVDEAHVFARDADELVVFRFEWANVQEAVFGEFVERDQPLAVSFFGFAH